VVPSVVPSEAARVRFTRHHGTTRQLRSLTPTSSEVHFTVWKRYDPLSIQSKTASQENESWSYVHIYFYTTLSVFSKELSPITPSYLTSITSMMLYFGPIMNFSSTWSNVFSFANCKKTHRKVVNYNLWKTYIFKHRSKVFYHSHS